MVASQRPHTDTLGSTLRLHTSTSVNPAQARCWNCEEAVHRLAESCPYCQKSLQVFHISPEDKVESTLYSTSVSSIESEIPTAVADIDQSSNILPILVATAALSCAGILLLLAALIWIFGDGTTFTLEWPQEMWRTFSALGILLLVTGSYFLSRSE